MYVNVPHILNQYEFIVTRKDVQLSLLQHGAQHGDATFLKFTIKAEFAYKLFDKKTKFPL